jgi:hypothetical protein
MGSAEGRSPFAGGCGVSPKPHSPQDWGIEGVEERIAKHSQKPPVAFLKRKVYIHVGAWTSLHGVLLKFVPQENGLGAVNTSKTRPG